MRTRRHTAPAYQLLSLVLDYPSVTLDERLAQQPAQERAGLDPFFRWWQEMSLPAREQQYVETFDLDRRTSLHLTYYLYGDTRKRGLALLRLKRMYAAAGLPLAADELPDYLPALLEFAALAPAGYGQTMLSEHRLALELLRLRLEEKNSPWACALAILCNSMSRLGPIERDRLARLRADGPPAEQVGLEPFAPPEVMPIGARP